MRAGQAGGVLVQLRETVRRWLDAGASLERIDAEVIAPARLDEERRAALWLCAWAHTDGWAARPPRRDAVH
jgi:hypothetical protein